MVTTQWPFCARSVGYYLKLNIFVRPSHSAQSTIQFLVCVVKGCNDILYAGYNTIGVYTINSDKKTEFEVYCDLATDSWGWIVFQRRQHASVSFHRTWNYYRSGFGDFGKNFWLGNYKIHRITAANKTLLPIELEDWSGKKVFAHYNMFKVDNEKNNYKITVIGYNGTSGDSLSYHNNMMFSTRDKDNDMWKTGSCSNDLTGGWWFNDCHNSDLNGQFMGNIHKVKALMEIITRVSCH